MNAEVESIARDCRAREFGDVRLPQRFWDRASLDEGTGCWLWTGYFDPRGVGYFRRRPAKAFCWEALKGEPAPSGLVQVCADARCVKPEHARVVTETERFEGMYVKDDSGCWLWQRNLTDAGYGRFLVAGRCVKAHRAAWRLYRGADPGEMDVLHRCDVPACVNPDHLYLGTHADNMADKGRKGRTGTSHLTGSDVLFMRDVYFSGALSSREIADLFSLTPSGVWRITSGDNWKYLSVGGAP